MASTFETVVLCLVLLVVLVALIPLAFVTRGRDRVLRSLTPDQIAERVRSDNLNLYTTVLQISRRQQALIKDNLAMAVAISESPIVIYDLDEAVISRVNRQAEVLFGYEPGKMTGRPITILLPEPLIPLHEIHTNEYSQVPRWRPMADGRLLPARKADGTMIFVDIELIPQESVRQVMAKITLRDAPQM